MDPNTEVSPDQVLELVYAGSVTQKRKIQENLKQNDFRPDLASFLKVYLPYLKAENFTLQKLIDSYLSMVDQFTYCRIQFLRTGKYPTENQEKAIEDVYGNQQSMEIYMLGLALSYFLWQHHYKIYKFYEKCLG